MILQHLLRGSKLLRRVKFYHFECIKTKIDFFYWKFKKVSKFAYMSYHVWIYFATYIWMLHCVSKVFKLWFPRYSISYKNYMCYLKGKWRTFNHNIFHINFVIWIRVTITFSFCFLLIRKSPCLPLRVFTTRHLWGKFVEWKEN